MKHYKYDKIRQFERRGGRLVPLISDNQKKLFSYAAKMGFLTIKNDAPRNAKIGLYYEVLRFFDEDRLREKMFAQRRRDAKKDSPAPVVSSTVVERFLVQSLTGGIKIDGTMYSNFSEDETITSEICEVDFGEFQRAEKITRRQVFNPNEPLTIVKFPEPREIEVALSDVDASFGVKKIARVCGFAVWAHKLKIFVAKR